MSSGCGMLAADFRFPELITNGAFGRSALGRSQIASGSSRSSNPQSIEGPVSKIVAVIIIIVNRPTSHAVIRTAVLPRMIQGRVRPVDRHARLRRSSFHSSLWRRSAGL